jgi:prepilin-type processing-associated H-X9-DG protein
VIILAIAFLIPTRQGARINSNRVACAANLKQIGNGLMLYANENKGMFPRTHAAFGAPVVLTSDGADDVDPFKIPPTGNKINNIPQAMFLLIRQEDLTPAVFVCRSGEAEADTMNSLPATSRSNFTDVAKNVSYSFVNVYPSQKAIEELKYKPFITGFSSDFAFAADISPLPIDSPVWKELKVGAPRSTIIKGNTKNHDGDGQNVLYADGHAEFQQTPLCGTDNDNIYTPDDVANSGKGMTAAGSDPDPRSATDSVLLINTP